MTRIFPDYIYGYGPREQCWWDQTCDLPHVPDLDTDVRCDVAIIGGGFTGLNAAIELAQQGIDVVVLDTQTPGFGASGRNGGFCCLGGSKLGDTALDRQFGRQGRLDWRAAEKAAVQHVTKFIETHSLDVDAHSKGETLLAHRPKDVSALEKEAEEIVENYGVEPTLHSRDDLIDMGISAGFHGGMTTPIGFALNPRKYLAGLIKTALVLGVRLFAQAGVDAMQPDTQGWTLTTARHRVTAPDVLVATNGYSSEHIPKWLAARFLPVQSSIVVSRPLTAQELDAQGWSSHQMCHDTRHLLHYFHLLPDNRMLFGLRGGLGGTAKSEMRARTRAAKHFRAMFPAWRDVELTHSWSGMVCMSRSAMPFVGPVPGQTGLHMSMCYHGNGVAMGSFSGKLVGEMIRKSKATHRPKAMLEPLRKFPFGSSRRVVMWPAQVALGLADL